MSMNNILQQTYDAFALSDYNLPPELSEKLEGDRLLEEAVRWGAGAILGSVRRFSDPSLKPGDTLLMVDIFRDMILLYEYRDLQGDRNKDEDQHGDRNKDKDLQGDRQDGLLLGAVSLNRFMDLMKDACPELEDKRPYMQICSPDPEEDLLIPLKAYNISQQPLLKRIAEDRRFAEIIQHAADDMITTMRTGTVEYGRLSPGETLLETDLERDMILLYEYDGRKKGNLITAVSFRKWEDIVDSLNG